MKLNLEIEIDWIDEEKGIDHIVKEEIISGVMRSIDKSVTSKIESKIESIIDETIVSRIDASTDKMFNEFLSRPVTITDSYGSSIKQFDNVESVIKEKFDNFMTQKVDEDGNSSASSYGRKIPRVEFIINKQLKDFAEDFTKQTVTKVRDEIKSHVSNGLKDKMGKELMTVLKVDKLLES